MSAGAPLSVPRPAVPAAAAGAPEEIFLFVNPKSGGNKGQDFLKVPQPFLHTVQDGRTVSLLIYSLIDADRRKEGFAKLKVAADAAAIRGARVRTIVGGGDGTVMWADTEAVNVGIDTEKQLAVGIIPLGTGNDFSRVAGWGGKNPKKILNDDYAVLRKLLNLWSKAQPRPHDVWHVEAEVDEDEGAIFKVDGGEEKDLEKHVITGSMINYFSIGQESKVGMDFDKHRTKSQTCNLMVYACSGFTTEMKCNTIQHVSDIISDMHKGTDSNAPLLFGHDEDDSDVPVMTGNPESLMFLNVNSYAGGMGHFWQLEASVGVDPAPPDEEVVNQADPGDGRLEVVTLPCIANIALDQLNHMAKRMHSGGPYYLQFFGPPQGSDRMKAYCQIDGEFYKLVNPLSVSITFLKRLQVLQNLEDEDMAEWQKWLSPAVWAPPDLVKSPQNMLGSGQELLNDASAAVQQGFQQAMGGIQSMSKRAVDTMNVIASGKGLAVPGQK